MTNRMVTGMIDGELLAMQPSPSTDDDSGSVVRATAASGASASLRAVAGIMSNNGTVNQNTFGVAMNVVGCITPVKFTVGGAPASSAEIGLPVYLSTTEGAATMTAPSASGEAIVRVGFLNRYPANSAGNYFVQFMPQFIGLIP